MQTPTNSNELTEFASAALNSPSLTMFLREHAGVWKSVKDTIHSTTSNSREKLWLVANNASIPQCKGCDNFVKWNVRKQQYNTFCCSQCANTDENKKASVVQTNRLKYGTAHPMQSSSVKNKTKNTNRKKYGADSPLCHPAVRQKIIETNITRYGVKYACQNSDIKEKISHTNQQRRGVQWASLSGDVRQKQLDTLNDNYGVDVPMRHPVIRNKQRSTQKQNAKICGYSSQQHISSHSLDLLSSASYLQHTHHDLQRSLPDIARELKVHPETVRQYCIKHGVSVHRYFQSTGEREVGEFVQQLGVLVSLNDRSIIPPYELDIYCPDHKIAIEYCGLYWHSEQRGKDKFYHQRKHDLCRRLGIQLITLFEDEWFTRKSQVQRKIKHLLNLDAEPAVYARDCNVIAVDRHTRQQFLDANHIQGDASSTFAVGLDYMGSLVALAAIQVTNNNTYLARFATSCRVVGGFSKIVTHVNKDYGVTDMVTFADARWSDGGLYKNTGWTLDKMLPPDYSYSPNGVERFHKSKYRRKNLPNLLDAFDPERSERWNCDNNNILRIWDCGKYRYVKHFS